MATAAMGTRFELVITRSHQPVGELVLAEIDDWHQRLNRFAPDSWVSHVNRTAFDAGVRCDDDTWAMLMDAQTVWRDSNGAFDITRGSGAELQLDPNARTIRFGRPGMALDLGGIAKGHALDCCAQILRDHHVPSAFLHGGTSSGLAIGLGPDWRPWRVRVGETHDLWLEGMSFSVSDAAGQVHAHIVDPRSGVYLGAAAGGAVVVTGPSARLCDAWSTALVVNGRLFSNLPAGYVVARPGA